VRVGNGYADAPIQIKLANKTIPTQDTNMLDALKLNSEEVTEYEEELRLRARELADDDRQYYFRMFKSEMKDPDTYAVLNWFFVAGLHHMYLGDWLRGALNLAILIIGIALLFSALVPLGIAMIAGLLVVELMALFRSQTIVANHNNLVSERILDDIDADN
jgi:TM2 domain-containing membrane protein YozV